MGETEHRAQRESLRAVKARPASANTAKSESLLQRYLSVALYSTLRRQRRERKSTRDGMPS